MSFKSLLIIIIMFVLWFVVSKYGGRTVDTTNKLLKQIAAKETADIPSQIQKLSELHKQGILTDEEFENKKSELLKKI